MIFSLQRRFLLLLLLPVAVILITSGVIGWQNGRNMLLDQWIQITRLKLDRAAHQIAMKLDEKLALIKLVAKTEEAPDQAVLQTFIIQQLIDKPGVKFVDLEPINKDQIESGVLNEPLSLGVEGLYTMELCGDYGFCAPVMDPDAPDKSLNIVRILSNERGPSKRLIVRISFDSFIQPLRQMELWEGGSAVLVTSTGQMLAATDRYWHDRRKLGETGDETELKVLDGIRHKSFGTVFSAGHPPATVVSYLKMPFINWYLLMFSQGKTILGPIVQFRDIYGAAGVAVILVILLIIRWVTRSVGSTISEISAAALKVKEGDYTVKLPVTRRDEIGVLRESFNQLVEGLQQRELIERTFGRYVDKKVAQELMSRPEALKLGGEKRTVTIMMSDLRNFTPISEKMEPEVVIKMLNRYFARMIVVIEKYRGIIVDFYGDSILVFFDGISSDLTGRACDAVRCALEMQQEMDGFLKENEAKGLPPVNQGIGVHTGDVIVGNIGTESRAKYGIVGADVNLTDRIQHTASAGKVIISERAYELIYQKLKVSLSFKACLKGVEADKKLYEIEGITPECARLPIDDGSGDDAPSGNSLEQDGRVTHKTRVG